MLLACASAVRVIDGNDDDSLYGNAVGDEGAALLAEALAVNTTLQELE